MSKSFLKKNWGHIVLLALFTLTIVLGYCSYRKDKTLSFGINKAYAAITVDSASAEFSGSSGSISQSFDFEGNYLVIGCTVLSKGSISSFNFDSFTLANSFSNTGDANENYYLAYAPVDASHHGTHSLQVNGSSNTTACQAISLNDVDSVRQTNSYQTDTLPSGINLAFSSAVDGDFLVGFARSPNSGNITTVSPNTWYNGGNGTATEGMWSTGTLTGSNKTASFTFTSDNRRGALGLDLIAVIPPAPGSTITLTQPAQYGTYWNDFGVWTVATTNISATTTYQLAVHFSRISSTTLEQINTGTATPQLLQTNTLSIPKSTPLSYAPLQNPVWYAQANLILNGQIQATSSIVQFGFITNFNASTSFPGFFNLTATSSPDCSGFSGNFFSSSTINQLGCVVKEAGYSVLGFLFKPGSYSNSLMSDAVDSFKTVFPFSVFFDIWQQVDDQATVGQTTASSTLTWNYQIGSATIPIVVGSSTLDNFIGSGNKNTVFTILRYMIWLLVGISLWNLVVPHELGYHHTVNDSSEEAIKMHNQFKKTMSGRDRINTRK